MDDIIGPLVFDKLRDLPVSLGAPQSAMIAIVNLALRSIQTKSRMSPCSTKGWRLSCKEKNETMGHNAQRGSASPYCCQSLAKFASAGGSRVLAFCPMFVCTRPTNGSRDTKPGESVVGSLAT